jgi:glyoxylase-like metal-dependent hydrolase (beta-lactamase superfamily II)/ferredoxin
MANFRNHHPLNVPGPLFTDLSCIDCGTCFHLGPALFRENTDDKSIVIRQPESDGEWKEAKRAILSCPTNSIGVHGAPQLFKELDPELPLHIDDNVYYLGFTSRDSFGATTYFIERPEGNVLIDSPRFHPWLVKELEKRGGVKYMVLSHQDDVADHQKFHDHFNCERYIHADDVNADTQSCEHILEGDGPFSIGTDLRIITTPGHSKGHVVVNYRNKFLFTGDHLFVDQEKARITASKGVCWYSWSEQVKSIEKLTREKFEWVLPGHGGWMRFGLENSHQKLQELIQSLRKH